MDLALQELDAGGVEDAKGSAPAPQAFARGLALLNLIAEAPQPMRFAELMQYSGLPKGTLHRMLQPLLDYRLIKFDERSQTYRLGNRVFEMAHKVWSEFDLRGAAEPELERLKALSKETVRLAVLDGQEALIIDQREFVQPMRMGNGIGSRLTATASALGKALLAYQSPQALAQLLNVAALDVLTPNTISDPGEFQRELDLGKARGYAVSVEEQFPGVSAVAVPILDHRGEAMGAISISGPSFRLTPERLHSLGRDVIESARRISGNVGEAYMTISNTEGSGRSVEAGLECAVPSSAFLGEAPLWLDATSSLLWIDILAPSVNVSNTVSGETRTTPLGELTGVIVPRRRGGYVAATQSGFRALDVHSGAMTTLAAPPGMAGRRFNDGKCDAAGRFWAGTLALDASPNQGKLYRLEAGGQLREMDSGFHVCNGMGWSPDNKRFYLADSGARAIYAYDFDLADGEVSNRRVFARFEDGAGVPDGLAIDADGHVWCAIWDGWAVQRFAPDGTLERTISMPVPRPTSCAFGGPDLKTLYITSARIRLSSSQLAAAPLSGSVFSLKTEVAGAPVGAFGG